MPLLLLKLLGIGKWLREAFSALLGLIRTYPLQAALIASLCLSGWLWRGWNKAEAETEVQRVGWTNEIKGRIADRKAYQAAQAEAERIWTAARKKHETELAEAARRADHADAENDRLRTAADRFADARRVRNYCPAGSATGNAPGSSEDRPAPSGDGQGADAVVLARSEYDELVGNTLRLERVRRWGEELIAESKAVKLEDVRPAF